VHVTEPILQQMRTIAISGAGLGTAIILGLLQLQTIDQPLLVAIYSASIAIPAWIAAWQYIQGFLVKGENSYARFDRKTARSLVVVSGVSLATTLGAVIWHFAPCASAIFAVTCLFSLLFVNHHNRSLGA
jgi:hypothetical protein